MRFGSILFVVATIVVGAICSPLVQSTVSAIQKDIQVIKTQTISLKNALDEFGNHPTETQLSSFLQLSVELTTSAKKAGDDAMATAPFSETDGQAILNQIKESVGLLFATLQELAAKVDCFRAAGLIPHVRAGLVTLQKYEGILSDALVQRCPFDQKQEASKLQSDIAMAFATTINALV